MLHTDGEGGYVFLPLDASARLKLLEEKHELEMKLAEVAKKRERLDVLLRAAAVGNGKEVI